MQLFPNGLRRVSVRESGTIAGRISMLIPERISDYSVRGGRYRLGMDVNRLNSSGDVDSRPTACVGNVGFCASRAGF
jgi:hypothetical protein